MRIMVRGAVIMTWNCSNKSWDTHACVCSLKTSRYRYMFVHMYSTDVDVSRKSCEGIWLVDTHGHII